MGSFGVLLCLYGLEAGDYSWCPGRHVHFGHLLGNGRRIRPIRPRIPAADNNAMYLLFAPDYHGGYSPACLIRLVGENRPVYFRQHSYIYLCQRLLNK